MAEQRKQFKSILDYKPQLQNIIEVLAPDIEFSYSAIMNNATIGTYFNMLSMENYGYEYFQLLKLNNLKFKDPNGTINLTVLEMVYNIVEQIVERKWRYSEYIAYDMYILPLRIVKYLNALNYRLITVETIEKKVLKKIVSVTSRAISEELVDTYHDDRINHIIVSYRTCPVNDVDGKLNLFKNLYSFILEAKSIVLQNFGTKFGTDLFKTFDEMNSLEVNKINDKQRAFVKKHIGSSFDIGILIILLMNDAIKNGVWSNIKKAELRRLETEGAKLAIKEANEKLEKIEIEEKKLQTSAKAIATKTTATK